MARPDFDEGGGRRFGQDDRLHITETPDVRHIGNPDVMHEESDVNVRGVGTFVGVLAAAMVVVCGLMVLMYNAFAWQAAREEALEARSPMARTEEERRPPAGVPRLQAAPGHSTVDQPEERFDLDEPQAEWNALRRRWEEELGTPGAADPNTGEGRIPIEEAKRKFLSGSQAVRQAPLEGGRLPTGVDIPSASSAGRQPEQRDR
ncbi:MAG: hypothetical protein LC800_15880 [Acidobacteria bacterium]|nr:hypothetical protein [Acidobacteriota bacterium]